MPLEAQGELESRVRFNYTNPNRCLVSGPDDFQIGMWACSNSISCIFIPFSDKMCKPFAVSRLLPHY